MACWERKPLLKDIYLGFYQEIEKRLCREVAGKIVELGSGLGNVKEVIPDCLRTDVFDNPWLDQVENAYVLSFGDGDVSHLILFDVFHHLRYPGYALAEFERVLAPGGRVIIFDPCISALGAVIYGAMHAEPVGWSQDISWCPSPGWRPENIDYYAAQGNATRVFVKGEHQSEMGSLELQEVTRMSAFSYVASGGYSGPKLYPRAWLPLMRSLDRVLDMLPVLFATRLLVVLEKTGQGKQS